MRSRWQEAEAAGLGPLDLMVYASRLIGADSGLVLWGGGNSSVKLEEPDFRGQPTRVLRVKGSGSDLKSMQPEQFAPVRLDDVLPLRERAAMSDEEMVAYLTHCLLDPTAPRPSIETLLHGFLPSPNIIHTHADAILGLTNTPDGRAQVEAVYGRDACWVPYTRPGFRMSKDVAEAVAANPAAGCVVLEKHGLITWGETARAAYEGTIERVTRAEEYAAEARRGQTLFSVGAPGLGEAERRTLAAAVAPALRGAIGRERRMVVRYDDSPEVRRFVDAPEAAQLSQIGPATADHVLNTKVLPLYVAGSQELLAAPEALKARLREAVAGYVAGYVRYYERYRRDEPMLEPAPRVVLVPGLGLFTSGRDIRAAHISAEIYRHTIGVIEAAAGLGGYRSLTEEEAFHIDYWPMELYKLTLAPPEQELARQVALVTGATGGIGKVVAQRLTQAGAHVVVTDMERETERLGVLARQIEDLAGAGRALAVPLDVTSEASVAAAFETAALAYGGVDIVFSNAGIAHSAPIADLTLEDWRRSLEINATGHFLVARAALRQMRQQGTGGSFIFNATKNVLAPSQDFAAYSASKAAETQLARVLAIEAASHGVRVNLVNPDAIFQDSGLWSPEVREQRARAQGIPADQIEDFYRQRNLLRVAVSADDVAEAVLFFASKRSSRTTGAILPVDGGLREAFPR